MKKILIMGGGTSGCIAALILKKRFPEFYIHIVESKNIGIVGVGEGSTEHWMEFCNFVEIDPYEVIRECDCTFKYGIMFDKWDKEPFLSSILSECDHSSSGYYYYYASLIANNFDKKTLQSPLIWDNKYPHTPLKTRKDLLVNQFHFDTYKLNNFLHKKCLNAGIDIFYDDIIDAYVENNDVIKYIFSENKKYIADFFIDCTGFKRFLLKEKLNVKWKSYSEYLPLNSAISFQTEEMDEYNMWTKSTAHSSGWGWQIPTKEKTGNGYVFCDKFITKEKAHEEMENYFGRSLDVAKEFKFDPGRLDKFWKGNCISIGLSSNFVEPLEATSIGSSIQQVFCLMNLLLSNDSDRYNDLMCKMFDNIVDFISAHYLVRKEDSPFWREIKYNLKVPNSLNYLLEMWKTRLPHKSDIFTPWGMFTSANYIPILFGLNWFSIEAIRNHILFHKDLYLKAQYIFNQNQQYYNQINMIGHKQAIKIINNDK